jgi:hypothetical protein
VQAHVQVLMQRKAGLQLLLEQAAAAERASTSQGGPSDAVAAGVAAAATAAPAPAPAAAERDPDADGSNCSSSSSSSSSSSTSEAAAAQPPASKSASRLEEDHPFAQVAIWRLPVVPLFFEAERPVAKQLAKDLMHDLTSSPVRA